MLPETVRLALQAAGYTSSGPLLLACSAGPDSMALGEILHELGMPFHVAHVNYRFRGADSLADSAAAAAAASRWGAPFHLLERPESTTPEGNLQAWARELRYAFFHETALQTGCRAILTGHHAGDAAENLLLGLFRGDPPHTWPLPERRPGPVPILRPLLKVSRTDILTYLHARAIPFRTDASNLQTTYNRNWLRETVLAGAQTRFPDTEAALQRAGSDLSAYAWLVGTALDSVRTPYGLSTFRLGLLPEPVARLVCGAWLAENGIASGLPAALRDHFFQTLSGLRGKRLSLSADAFLHAGDDGCWIEKRGHAVPVPGSGTLRYMDAVLTAGPQSDPGALPWQPGLSLRLRLPGDRIRLEPGATPVPVKDLLDRRRVTGDRRRRSLTLVAFDGSVAAVIFATEQNEAGLICSDRFTPAAGPNGTRIRIQIQR